MLVLPHSPSHSTQLISVGREPCLSGETYSGFTIKCPSIEKKLLWNNPLTVLITEQLKPTSFPSDFFCALFLFIGFFFLDCWTKRTYIKSIFVMKVYASWNQITAQTAWTKPPIEFIASFMPMLVCVSIFHHSPGWPRCEQRVHAWRKKSYL